VFVGEIDRRLWRNYGWDFFRDWIGLQQFIGTWVRFRTGQWQDGGVFL